MCNLILKFLTFGSLNIFRVIGLHRAYISAGKGLPPEAEAAALLRVVRVLGHLVALRKLPFLGEDGQAHPCPDHTSSTHVTKPRPTAGEAHVQSLRCQPRVTWSSPCVSTFSEEGGEGPCRQLCSLSVRRSMLRCLGGDFLGGRAAPPSVGSAFGGCCTRPCTAGQDSRMAPRVCVPDGTVFVCKELKKQETYSFESQ